MLDNNFFKKKKNIIILALFVAALWGSAFPCVKIGYGMFNIKEGQTFSYILYAGLRFMLAGVLALIISTFLNKKLIAPNKKNSPYIFSLGIFQTTMQYLSFYIGIYYATGVQSSILVSTFYVVFVVLLSMIFFKNEHITTRKLVGCLLGVAGAVATFYGVGFKFSIKGEGLVIVSSLFFAVGSIISKKIPKEIDSVSINGWQLLLGGMVLTIIGVIGGGEINPVGISAWTMLLYLAIISSFGFVVWTLLLRYNPTEEITVFNLLIPIFGTILSGLLLGEKFLTLTNLISLIFVCAGIYIVNRGERKKRIV